MRYVYPAIFTPLENEGGYDVHIPDLPHVSTCADTLADAIDMAEDAASMWLADAEDKGRTIPVPSGSLPHKAPQFVNLVKADTEAYRRATDNRSVRKNLTIPAWLNNQAEAAHLNFSGILQEALKEHLKITG